MRDRRRPQPVLGGFLTRVLKGERTFLSPILRPIEIGFYRLAGVDERSEQSWLTYAIAMLLFHVGGFLFLYASAATAGPLPFNPAGQTRGRRRPADQYRDQLRHQHQLAELRRRKHDVLSRADARPDDQNFLSAATGIVIAVALDPRLRASIRQTIGNFWVDMTRCTLYLLLPIAIVFALFVVWQGMPQTLGANVDATTLEGAKQTIALGPVASQVAIKMLGTNGGGFFNANCRPPVREPDGAVELRADVLDLRPRRGADHMFGRMVGNQRQGWAVFAAMVLLFLAGSSSLLLGGSPG